MKQRLKEVLHYDPRSGDFRWRVSIGTRAKAGRIAGSLNQTDYIVVRVDGCAYLAHRLAFLYMMGKWPKTETDHINRVRHNNRWANLREATRSQNLRNAGARKANETREKNVTKTRGKFRVLLRVGNKVKSFGHFHQLRNAVLVRDVWTEFYGLSF